MQAVTNPQGLCKKIENCVEFYAKNDLLYLITNLNKHPERSSNRFLEIRNLNENLKIVDSIPESSFPFSLLAKIEFGGITNNGTIILFKENFSLKNPRIKKIYYVTRSEPTTIKDFSKVLDWLNDPKILCDSPENLISPCYINEKSGDVFGRDSSGTLWKLSPNKPPLLIGEVEKNIKIKYVDENNKVYCVL